MKICVSFLLLMTLIYKPELCSSSGVGISFEEPGEFTTFYDDDDFRDLDEASGSRSGRKPETVDARSLDDSTVLHVFPDDYFLPDPISRDGSNGSQETNHHVIHLADYVQIVDNGYDYDFESGNHPDETTATPISTGGNEGSKETTHHVIHLDDYVYNAGSGNDHDFESGNHPDETTANPISAGGNEGLQETNINVINQDDYSGSGNDYDSESGNHPDETTATPISIDGNDGSKETTHHVTDLADITGSGNDYDIESGNHPDETTVATFHDEHTTEKVPIRSSSDANTPLPDEQHLGSSQLRNRSSLFGFPTFCSRKAYSKCKSTTLVDCPHCSKSLSLTAVLCAVAIGLIVVFGNILVLYTTCSDEKFSKSHFLMLKSALAIADLLNGCFLLAITLPNILWTIGYSAGELHLYQLHSKNSGVASAFSIMFYTVFLWTVYLLVVMTAMRLYAILFPARIKDLGRKHVIVAVLVALLISLALSTIPLWRDGGVSYEYQHVIYQYGISLEYNVDTASPVMWFLLLAVVGPCVFLVAATLATWCKMRGKLDKLQSRKESFATSTVTFMIAGFVLTTIPFVVVMLLSSFNTFNTDTVSLPYTVCYFIFHCRSIVNVIVHFVCNTDSPRVKAHVSLSNFSSTTNRPAIVTGPNDEILQDAHYNDGYYE